MTISLVSDITLKSNKIVCDWQTQYIYNIHSLVNSHNISMPGCQFSLFRDKMSLARDTGHLGSIPGRSRPFRDGWQAYCRFNHRRVGTSGGCNGGCENVLAVGNCCYVAVCSAAELPEGASAPRWRGGGHTVAAVRLQLVDNWVLRRRLKVSTF